MAETEQLTTHTTAVAENTIVTIVTHSFLIYAQALRQAIREFDDGIGFVALVTDPPADETLPDWTVPLQELCESLPAARSIAQQYGQPDQADLLRWSLKSQLMHYALQQGAQKVVWCDPDLMFFNDPNILFDQIAARTVLLSPHYRSFRPSVEEHNFGKNFTEGMFQAGFLGVGHQAREVLDWWAECCLWNMRKDESHGLWVDQKYLDFVPVLWPDTRILRHFGCNLAEWNRHECRRQLTSDGTIVNETDRVLFIHFTDGTIREIQKGNDEPLREFLESYLTRLRGFDPGFKPRTPPPPAAPEPPRSGLRLLLLHLLDWLRCRLA